jgi:hypothetical protein
VVAKAPRRLVVGAVVRGDRSSESTQGAIGGARLGGDRCVAQLTTLLQRIEGRSLLRLSPFATAEQQR